jgi:hypothetical protein
MEDVPPGAAASPAAPAPGDSAPPGAAPPAPAVAAAAARQPLPKQLTAAIKSASSVERLTQLFNDHAALLNPIHVAAMITKLPKLEAMAGVGRLTPAGSAGSGSGSGGSSADALPWLPPLVSASRALLAQLLSKIKTHDMAEYSPRGLANIVWALAKLQHYPDPDLQARLLNTFVERLPAAVPQVRRTPRAHLSGGVARARRLHPCTCPPPAPPFIPAPAACAQTACSTRMHARTPPLRAPPTTP